MCDFLAQFLAGVDPKVGPGLVLGAEGKVDKAEESAQFIVASTLQERDKVSKFCCRLLRRFVTSGVGKEGRSTIAEPTTVVRDEWLRCAVAPVELDTRCIRLFDV